jgi:cbb3-type cytochrome c oxidase subunit III
MIVCAVVFVMNQPATGQSASLPEGVTELMVEQGEVVFKGEGNCWACHGADATGSRGVGPNLTDDDWWHSDGTYEAIVNQILSGVSSDQARNAFSAMMPPRGGSGINEEQVRAVAAYVWSLRQSRQPEGS